MWRALFPIASENLFSIACERVKVDKDRWKWRDLTEHYAMANGKATTIYPKKYGGIRSRCYKVSPLIVSEYFTAFVWVCVCVRVLAQSLVMWACIFLSEHDIDPFLCNICVHPSYNRSTHIWLMALCFLLWPVTTLSIKCAHPIIHMAESNKNIPFLKWCLMCASACIIFWYCWSVCLVVHASVLASYEIFHCVRLFFLRITVCSLAARWILASPVTSLSLTQYLSY